MSVFTKLKITWKFERAPFLFMEHGCTILAPAEVVFLFCFASLMPTGVTAVWEELTLGCNLFTK